MQMIHLPFPPGSKPVPHPYIYQDAQVQVKLGAGA